MTDDDPTPLSEVLGDLFSDERPTDGECVDCGQATQPTETERGWSPPAERCPACRRKRQKASREPDFEKCWSEAAPSKRHRLAAEKYQPDPPAPLRCAVSSDERFELDCAAYIYGNPGTAKTMICYELVRRYLYHWIVNEGQSVSAAIVAEPDYYAELQATYDGPGRAEEIIARYQRVGLLVVDDLGVASGSEWQREQLYQLVDKRYESLKPTIFSSNRKIEALPYGDRITSRISDACEERVVEATENYRH